MAVFEFMMVLTSIVIALAMTEILSGFVRILKGELAPHWIHATFAIAGFLGILQLFWDLYSYSVHVDWQFGDLLTIFVAPCVIFYLAAALLFPTQGGETSLELHFDGIARVFFAVLVPLMPVYIYSTYRLDGDLWTSVDIYRVAFFTIYVALAISRSRRLLSALAILHIGLLFFFVLSDLFQRSIGPTVAT